MKSKISTEELDRLRSLRAKHDLSKDDVAKLEVRICRLKSQKPKLLMNFDSSEYSLAEYESELTSKYGEGIKVNLGDGTITRQAD